MDSLFSQIQTLDASDIASILRQVQGGELTLEEAQTGANQSTSQCQDGSRGMEPVGDDSHSIIETVQDVAETIAQTDSDPTSAMSPARLMSLRRPGRNTLPLQSVDVDIPVPQSRTELQKQIFQARMMGAPSDVAERITQRTGIGSPPRVRPNIGLSRSLSHPPHQEERLAGDDGEISDRCEYPEQRQEYRGDVEPNQDRSRSPVRRRDERRVSAERERSSDKKHSRERKKSSETRGRTSPVERSSHKSRARDKEERGISSKRPPLEDDRSRPKDDKKAKIKEKMIAKMRKRREKDRQKRRSKSESDESSTNPRYLLSGITEVMEHEQLWDHFSRYGVVADLVLAPSQGCGYIDFVAGTKRRKTPLINDEHFLYDTFIVCTKVILEQDSSKSTSPKKDQNKTIEEAPVALTALEQQPVDHVVHSQVDKDVSGFSIESLGRFKIPKKAPAALGQPKPADEKDKAPVLSKDDHKRGASHENKGLQQPQAWHGVLPKLSPKSGGSDGSRTASIVRGLTTELSKLDDLMKADWLDNMGRIRTYMPQIPSVFSYLSREDLNEIQEEYLRAVDEGTVKIESGHKKYQQVKKELKQVIMKQHMKKCKNPEDWIKNQIEIFENLDLGEEIEAVNLAESIHYTCFICNTKTENAKGYSKHICAISHEANTTCAATSLGKRFYVKYLQKVAKDDAFKNEEAKNEASKDGELTEGEARFCEVCMQSYKWKWQHFSTQEHKIAMKMRPKCEVCDIIFNNVKDQLQHLSRHYHKHNVQRKIEYGELPADFKDPILEAQAAAGVASMETQAIPLDEPMDADDSDTDMDQQKGQMTPVNREPTPLFNNTNRKFFGKTVEDLARSSPVRCAAIIPNPKHEQDVKDLCSQTTYDKEDYYEDGWKLMGLNKRVHEHVSKPDWIDVLEEYKSKMENLYIAPNLEFKQVQEYYYSKNGSVLDMKKGIDVRLTEESSIQQQCSLLSQLGMEDTINGKKAAMVNWYCYVCMRAYDGFEDYKDHYYDVSHRHNTTRAGTTIGNMFLIKVLQCHLVTTPDSSHHQCSICQIKPVSGDQGNSEKLKEDKGTEMTNAKADAPTSTIPVKESMKNDDSKVQERKDRVKTNTVSRDVGQTSLFNNTSRKFFGRTIDDIARKSNVRLTKIKQGAKAEQMVRDFCSQATYEKEDYYKGAKRLPGISYNVHRHVSKQDWIDVLEEYKSKMGNLFLPSKLQWEQLKDFYNKDTAQEIRAVIDSKLTEESSIEQQWTMLNHLGMQEVINGKKDAMVNWYCYVCMTAYDGFQGYEDHILRRKNSHDYKTMLAGTTIGNMFLVKFLQCHLVTSSDSSHHQCSICQIKAVSGDQGNSKNVEQKFVETKLPADFKDPILETKTVASVQAEASTSAIPPEGPMDIDDSDILETKTATEDKKGAQVASVEASTSAIPPDGLMDIDDSDMAGDQRKEVEMKTVNKDIEPAPLFNNTNREFFGKTVEYIKRGDLLKNSEVRITHARESQIKDLFSQTTYDKEDYYEGGDKLFGISKYIYAHVSKQDWIDVLEEYKSKMENLSKDSFMEYRHVMAYYNKDTSVQEIRANIDSCVTNESSIDQQWALLNQLGMQDVINGKKDAMVNWYCYVCMTSYNEMVDYSSHLEMGYHRTNVIKAGTTIGNMFLKKFLQCHLVTTPDSSHHQCPICQIKPVSGDQGDSKSCAPITRYFLGGVNKKFLRRSDLEDYFSQFGPVAYVQIATGKGFAWIEFENRSDADKATREKKLLQTHRIRGNNVVCQKTKNQQDLSIHREEDEESPPNAGEKPAQSLQETSNDGRKTQVQDIAKQPSVIFLEQLLHKDWFDNMSKIRKYMPQIPSVCTYLSRKDLREVKVEYFTAVKKKTMKFACGLEPTELGNKLQKGQRISKQCVLNSRIRSDWINSQLRLFKELGMRAKLEPVKLSKREQFTCFLCHTPAMVPKSKPDEFDALNNYNDHLLTKQHLNNMAAALTILGRMFYVKHLQKIAKGETAKKGAQKKSNSEPNWCERCMVYYTATEQNHKKSSKHRRNNCNKLPTRCEVCNYTSSRIKFLIQHMRSEEHKATLRQRIENGELPPDYDDYLFKDMKRDQEQYVSGLKGDDSSNIKSPEEEEPMEIDESDVEIKQEGVISPKGTDSGPTDSDRTSLFKDGNRVFFGRTVEGIMADKKTGPSKKTDSNPKMDSLIRDLCSPRTYNREDYYSGLCQNLLGIQKNVWQHVSKQDWIDVVEEYLSKMDNIYEESCKQFSHIGKYYLNFDTVIELKRLIRNELTEESSIPHQWAILCQLGLREYISGSKDAMVNWFCYVCMANFYRYQPYKDHLRIGPHNSKVHQAGTTIGNMFLVKFLQRHLVEAPAATHQYCSHCDVTHTDPYAHRIGESTGHREVNDGQTKEGELRCEVCNMAFLTEEERTQHSKNIRHNMVKVCKTEHGLIPTNFEEVEEEQTTDVDKQDTNLEPEECSRIEEELKAMGKDPMTDYIQGFYCVPCNVFVNKATGEDLEQTQKTHVGLEAHLQQVKRYYEELDRKKQEECREMDEGDGSPGVDSIAIDANPTNDETEMETMVDNTDEQSEEQQTNTEPRTEGSTPKKRTSSIDDSKSAKKVKKDDISTRRDITNKDSDLGHGNIIKDRMGSKQDKSEDVSKLGSMKNDRSKHDKPTKDRPSVQKDKPSKQGASKDGEDGSHVKEPETSANKVKSSKDVTSKHGKVVWDRKIKLVRCSVVLKRLSSSDIQRHCQKTESGTLGKRQKPGIGPKSVMAKLRAKKKKKKKKLSPSPDSSSDSDEDMPLSVHSKRPVKDKKGMERNRSSTRGSSIKIKREVISPDSSSDNEDMPLSVHSKRTGKARKETEQNHSSTDGSPIKIKQKAKRKRSVSSDSSSDIEELPLSVHSKRTAKARKETEQNHSSTDGNPVKIKLKAKRKLPVSSDSSSDIVDLPLSVPSRRTGRNHPSIKTSQKDKIKQEPPESSHKKRTMRKVSSTEDRKVAILDAKTDKSKTGIKVRRTSSVDKSGTGDNTTSTSEVREGANEVGSKKRRTSSSGSSITGASNIRRESGETGQKKRSHSGSSNSDIANSAARNANSNSNETAQKEKPQSASRRDSVNVDIADIFFKESDMLKAKKTLNKAKLGKGKKTVDNSKPKVPGKVQLSDGADNV